MNKCILVVIGLFLVIHVFAAGPCDLINGCFYEGTCYTRGQKVNFDRDCYQVKCNGNNRTRLTSCLQPRVPAGCAIIDDIPGSFPDCCPKVVCSNK